MPGGLESNTKLMTNQSTEKPAANKTTRRPKNHIHDDEHSDQQNRQAQCRNTLFIRSPNELLFHVFRALRQTPTVGRREVQRSVAGLPTSVSPINFINSIWFMTG